MKRPLWIVVSVVLSLILITAVSVLAAPRGQEQRPLIAQPEPDAVVRGVVQVVGTATHPQFQRYELYYAPWPVPSDQSWIFIGPDAHFQQQPLGLLGTWDSRAVPDGTYALRVRVVKVDGNYIDSDPRRVLVANTRQIETPTPAATNTPTTVPTPLPPTPTIVVLLPALETPTTQPTAEAQPTTMPILPSANATEPTAPAAGDLINVGRLLEVAQMAAFYTVAAFVALGVFFGFKALLVWIWHRIRP
jgi:hypothetical protein